MLSFIMILLVFNTLLRIFIAEQAITAMQMQYATLDAYHSGEKSPQKTTGNIFETTYVIVDDQFNIQYISASLYDLSEKMISKKVVDDFINHPKADWSYRESSNYFLAQLHQFRKVRVDGASYMVKMKSYSGQLEGNYIAKSDAQSSKYYVFVFANVTPIEEFESYINILLLVVMVIVGLVANLSIYVTSRKLDRNFSNLKSYILRLGNREKMEDDPYFAYHEFNEVRETVNHMSDLIDANQRSQQLFFQNSSHELRTPLMSIQGYAEGIREGIIPNTQEAAGIIVDESDKMAHLVEDMLTLSKMESIQTQLHLEPINITDLLYDVTWRLKAAADERGLVFVHHFSSEEVMIEGDEKLLERAVSNIVSNAIRYDNKYLTISVEQLETGVRIELANDGEPIAADDLEHLFERFYKSKSGQFGLGLAITKEIIERHQGTIRATSNEEKTCFIIDLLNTQKHL